MVVLMGAHHLPRNRIGRVAFGVALFFQMTLLGSTPIGEYSDSSIMIPLALVGQLSLFGLLLWGRHAAPGCAKSRVLCPLGSGDLFSGFSDSELV